VTQSEPDPEQPDGAVRRYVREQWDTDTSVRRPRRRTSSTLPPSPGPRSPGPQHATPAAGLGVVRPAPEPVATDAERETVEWAAGPDIVRPDGAGPHVVADLPRVPEARSASDHTAHQAPWTPPR
jgi:hypothetical protein